MKYNYFYYGTPILKSQFEKEVPYDWQDNLDEDGDYSFGGYDAKQI